MLNCMVDIETMGTGITAPILSIGAVMFDMDKNKLGKEFYVRITLESAMHFGEAEASALRFWLKQPDAAREELCGTHKRVGVSHLNEALNQFREWLPKSECEMWGNGCSFDIVMLEQMFKKCKIKAPWDYWNHKCLRTLKLVSNELGVNAQLVKNDTDAGTLHNALDDAKAQAQLACTIMRKLKVKR